LFERLSDEQRHMVLRTEEKIMLAIFGGHHLKLRSN
jgi:hypothetical protein